MARFAGGAYIALYVREVAERIRALRRGARLEGVTIRQLLEEGRRY